MTNRLKNRTAIITGAGQGIGAATAQRMAEEGARIIIAELNEVTGEQQAARLREMGYQAIAIQTDVANADSINRMVDMTVKMVGVPDILVNNAGINVFGDPLSCTTEDWERCFGVNLEGMWHCCKAVLPHMLTLGKGSIVNIASIHGLQIIPNCFPYPVTKHGILGLTKALAIDFAAKNIRVNSISPGYVETPNVINYWATFPDPEAERQRALNLHPMKRIATPDEIAWAVVFLASDEAGFITGENLVIDGGRTVLFHE